MEPVKEAVSQYSFRVIHGYVKIILAVYYVGEMVDITRDKETGKFAQKSEGKRKVRSIRLTDATYDYLKLKADENNKSIADLIELIAEDKLLENKGNIDSINKSNKMNIDFINKAKELIYDETLVRTKDRWLPKKILAKLLNVETNVFDNKP